MVVRRVDPLSFAKVVGALYALMGLLIGGLISLFAIVGGAMVPQDLSAGLPGMLFGVTAIIALPIFYGVLGFVTSLIGAAMYNVIASAVGGIQIDVQ